MWREMVKVIGGEGLIFIDVPLFSPDAPYGCCCDLIRGRGSAICFRAGAMARMASAGVINREPGPGPDSGARNRIQPDRMP